MSTYQATLYPATEPSPIVANADPSRKKLAVCFSGGGSRALTCAWGQMLGLATLQAGGQAVMDQVRYISSVSGGSWAAVLYTFRADSLSDAEFLGAPCQPAQLAYGTPPAGGLDVTTMGASMLGKVPQNFANLFTLDPVDNIIADFLVYTLLKGVPAKDSLQWLWMYIVGENVLADFGLYSYHNSLLHPFARPWDYCGAKSFSLSPAYAQQHIFSQPHAPSNTDFTYARSNGNGQPGGPMLIINTNIVGQRIPGVTMSTPLQIPVQASAVATGVAGQNPCMHQPIGGGMTESFAFTSTLKSANGDSAQLSMPRIWSLADITSCSSSFYASALAKPIQTVAAALKDLSDEYFSHRWEKWLAMGLLLLLPKLRADLAAIAQDLRPLADLVPKYNYWPLAQTAQGAQANRISDFTDGGDLENTGVAGLLAQVQGDANKIIAFVNGDEVLQRFQNQPAGEIIAATQMAPLFGVAYDATSGSFQPYGANGVNPFTGETDPAGFLQMFDNSSGQFDALRAGLYAANGSGQASGPAFMQQTLTLVANTLLGIYRGIGQQVTILWVQNAVVHDWQNRLTDPVLRQKLDNGQQQGGDSEFANFPYYNTFFKIHQSAAETNTLAQMWAWCVADPASPLSSAILQLLEMPD